MKQEHKFVVRKEIKKDKNRFKKNKNIRGLRLVIRQYNVIYYM